jgi:hypothetical protein
MSKIIFSLLVSLPLISCWKPVSHPAAFTVHQNFPAHGIETISRKSSNEILASDSVDSLLDSIHRTKHEFTDDVSAFGLNDGRFFSSKALNFENSHLNGIFHDVSSDTFGKLFQNSSLALSYAIIMGFLSQTNF